MTIELTWKAADLIRSLIRITDVPYVSISQDEVTGDEVDWHVNFMIPHCTEVMRDEIINKLRNLGLLQGQLEGDFQYIMKTLDYEYTTSTLSGELSIFQKVIRE